MQKGVKGSAAFVTEHCRDFQQTHSSPVDGVIVQVNKGVTTRHSSGIAESLHRLILEQYGISTSVNPLTAKNDIDTTTSPPNNNIIIESCNIIIESSPCKKQRKGRTIPSPPKSFHNTLHEPKYSPGIDTKNVERIARGRSSMTGFVVKSVENNNKKLKIVESELKELRKGQER